MSLMYIEQEARLSQLGPLVNYPTRNPHLSKQKNKKTRNSYLQYQLSLLSNKSLTRVYQLAPLPLKKRKATREPKHAFGHQNIVDEFKFTFKLK